MSTSHEDRWLLPRHQTEYPAWDFLAEETLHGRREATCLVLSAIFLVTTTLLVVLGASRVIDPAVLIARLLPDIEIPVAMRIPFGVIPFALGGIALALICELYGRRRATALVAIGLVANIGLGGLMWLADRLDGHDASFGPALGFAGCYLVGYLLYVPLFDALRRRMAGRHLWLRLLVLSPAAQLAGWSAFGAAMVGFARLVGTEPDIATITAIATGSALYTLACVVVLTLPIALVTRGLRLFLRVGHHEADDDGGYRGGPDATERIPRRRFPAADDDARAPARRRPIRPSLQPFSSAEMRFFAEGDRLAESGAES